MRDKPISELVKDPNWQKVRKSLIGQWKERPDWCIRQLRLYLGPIENTKTYKLYIIMNYLVSSGFRTGKISSKDNPEISKLRGEISAEIKRRKYKL